MPARRCLTGGIQQRMTGQETRNKLTDYWQESGVKKGEEFAVLTNIIPFINNN